MEWYDAYLGYLRARGYAETTVEIKGSYLSRFYCYMRTRGIVSAQEVTPGFLEEYKAHLRGIISRKTGEPYSIATLQADIITVRRYFAYISSEGHLLIDPAYGWKIPSSGYRLPGEMLNEQEMKRLLEIPSAGSALGIRDRAILELLYSSGIRHRELYNLNVYDVDLIGGVVRITKGKNRKDRAAPIGRLAVKALERYLREVRWRLKERSGNLVQTEEALFLTKNGTRMNYVTLGRVVNKYVRKIFPGRRISCHSMRHSCATHMVRGGANIRYVQELLGHASLSSTQIYTRLSPNDVKEVHKRCHPRGKILSKIDCKFNGKMVK